MSMRRLSFTLLCGLMLLLVPAGIAAVGATGDGVLELRDVNATTVTIKGNKGVIWGQIDKGTLRVTDLNPDDNVAALVSGGWLKLPTADPAVTLYTGKNIHFRFTGNRYIKFSIVGSGIDVTAVGVGRTYLVGDPEWYDDGDYALDNGKWQSVPLLPKLVLFGTQPTSAP